MRWKRTVLAAMLGGVAMLGTSGVSASDDLPRTFAGCVMSGGDVRMLDGELTCRLARSYDFRVYGSGTTECGEQIQLEHWGETLEGVMTYPFEPLRTVDLPTAGDEMEDWSGSTPIPCLED